MKESDEMDPLNTAVCRIHTEAGFLWSKVKHYYEHGESVFGANGNIGKK